MNDNATFGNSCYLGTIETCCWVRDASPAGTRPARHGVVTVAFYAEVEAGEIYFVLTHPALADQIRRPLPGLDMVSEHLGTLIGSWYHVTGAYEISHHQRMSEGKGNYRYLDFPSVFRRLGLLDKNKCLAPLLTALVSLPVPPWHSPYMVY